MPVHIALFANAASGSGATPADAVVERLRARAAEVHRHDLEELGSPGDPCPPGAAAALVRDADRIVVAGGDGSIGLVAAAAAAAGLPLAVVPTGTANDFARAVGIPEDLDAACALACDPGAAVRPLDLAGMGPRPFVNAAGAGLAPVAARHARPLKPRLGPLAYAAGALRAGLTAKPVRVRVRAGDRTAFDGRAWQIVVANTGAFGGGSATGAADPGDGALDVTVVPAGSRAALVRRGWAMRRGTLAAQDGVVHARGASVEVETTSPFNVDGELCPSDGRTAFSVRERAFGVVVGAA